MKFIQKNFVTMLVVGATVVLAGVAMFTAMRLYTLRQNPVTPVEPASNPSASDGPLGIRPTSGNWNLPETFLITNTSDADVEVVWNIDCWDENLCEDTQGTEVLAPGESVEKGLGSICSQWQIELNWSGTATAEGDVWDWAGVAELDPSCDKAVEDLTTTDTTVIDELTSEQDAQIPSIDETTVQEPASINTDIETTSCSAFTFTLGSDTGIGGAEETLSPSPTATVTATPIASAIVTATPIATKTPTVTATPAALPEAGVGTPVIIGIMAGGILLLLSIALAI